MIADIGHSTEAAELNISLEQTILTAWTWTLVLIGISCALMFGFRLFTEGKHLVLQISVISIFHYFNHRTG